MALATTLKAYLRQMQWQFYEKGMQRVWNALAEFANEQDDGTNVVLGGARVYYGDIIFSTDTGTPMVAANLPDETEGRDGSGAIYPDKKYPPNGVGFVALS